MLVPQQALGIPPAEGCQPHPCLWGSPEVGCQSHPTVVLSPHPAGIQCGTSVWAQIGTSPPSWWLGPPVLPAGPPAAWPCRGGSSMGLPRSGLRLVEAEVTGPTEPLYPTVALPSPWSDGVLRQHALSHTLPAAGRAPRSPWVLCPTDTRFS